MRPKPFADLLKQWLLTAGHPGVVDVRTCAEIGRHEQPMGVQVTLSDGWAFVLQVVRTAPDGGDRAGEDVSVFGWDRDAYREAREATDRAARSVKPPARGAKPQAKVTNLLTLALDAVKRAGHPEVVAVEVSTRADRRRDVLRVSCVDGSTIYGLPAGFIPPGGADFTRPAHDIPKGLVGDQHKVVAVPELRRPLRAAGKRGGVEVAPHAVQVQPGEHVYRPA
jgi:hypothetical protein